MAMTADMKKRIAQLYEQGAAASAGNNPAVTPVPLICLLSLFKLISI
jgi:hypothetical protein